MIKIKKIDILKRINRRKQLINKIKEFFKISLDDILEIETNDRIMNELISVIQDASVYKELDELSLERKKREAIEETVNFFKKLDSLSSSYYVAFMGKTEIEIIEVSTNEMFENFNILLDIIGFSDGYGDLSIFAKDLSFVYYIEQNEYKNNVKVIMRDDDYSCKEK